METKKVNHNFYHQAIAITGMFVIAGSQFAGEDLQLYIIFTTIAVMLISVLFKMRREMVDGVFDKTKYISAAWAILFSIGIFIYFRFFAM